VSPITLLIVDDHPVVRDGLRGMFAGDAGFDVVGEAGDGATAVSAIRKLTPDVVLLDVQLPDENGIDLAARLADDRLLPAVILTSSRPPDQLGPELTTSGALGFIPKDELTATAIRRLLP
jgi:DNA-binding NarL/FixJ family response regulator